MVSGMLMISSPLLRHAALTFVQSAWASRSVPKQDAGGTARIGQPASLMPVQPPEKLTISWKQIIDQ